MTSRFCGMVGMVAVATCLAAPAFADSLEGAYVGAAVGLAQVETSVGESPLAPPDAVLSNFAEAHVGYHLLFGVRPPGAPVGLELEYLDLGQPDFSRYSGSATQSGSVSQRGGGLFLLYYLPTPIVQAYVKAGGTRITTHANFVSCATCPPVAAGPTNTSFAAGAGLQWTLGRWAVRAEYERLNAGGGHPSLLTLGFAWTFI